MWYVSCGSILERWRVRDILIISAYWHQSSVWRNPASAQQQLQTLGQALFSVLSQITGELLSSVEDKVYEDSEYRNREKNDPDHLISSKDY